MNDYVRSEPANGALSWPARASSFAWSSDDRWLLVADERDLLLVEVGTWTVRVRKQSADGTLAYWGLAVSPDGRMIAAATPLRIELWTPDLAHPIHPFVNLLNGPPLAFADAGRTLVVLLRDDCVGTWNLESFTQVRTTRLVPPGSHVLGFSHRGTVSVNVRNRRIGVWDLAWGVSIWEQSTDDPLPSCVQFSLDDTALLVAHRYHHSAARVVMHSTETGAIAWSADGSCGAHGKNLSITSDMGRRNLLNTPDGKLVGTFVLSDLPAAASMGFSHAQQYVAEIDVLGNLRVWRVRIDGGLSLAAPIGDELHFPHDKAKSPGPTGSLPDAVPPP